MSSIRMLRQNTLSPCIVFGFIEPSDDYVLTSNFVDENDLSHYATSVTGVSCDDYSMIADGYVYGVTVGTDMRVDHVTMDRLAKFRDFVKTKFQHDLGSLGYHMCLSGNYVFCENRATLPDDYQPDDNFTL